MYPIFFKRLFDLSLSAVALIVLSPVLLILTLVGAITMKGNPFFMQARPGKKDKNGKEKIFKLIKFRTMSNAKDKNGNLLPDSQRLGKYGAWLRSTSLDELPELWDIFIGKMSIAGPRPQLVRDLVFMDEETRKRHDVRPGLTGLAQVSGRNNLTWEERFEYDLDYVKKVRLFRDIKIIFQTVFKVFKRSDVATEGMETSEDLGDYLLRTGKVTEEDYQRKQLEAKELLKA